MGGTKANEKSTVVESVTNHIMKAAPTATAQVTTPSNATRPSSCQRAAQYMRRDQKPKKNTTCAQDGDGMSRDHDMCRCGGGKQQRSRALAVAARKSSGWDGGPTIRHRAAMPSSHWPWGRVNEKGTISSRRTATPTVNPAKSAVPMVSTNSADAKTAFFQPATKRLRWRISIAQCA